MSELPLIDETISWAESASGGPGKPFKPSVAVMIATDTNWIYRHDAVISPYYTSAPVNNSAMMNCGTPGMKLPGILAWSVNESIDTVVNTATLELMNALPVSQIETTLTSSLPALYHSQNAIRHWYRDPADGVTRSTTSTTPNSIKLFEQNVLYREFANETFTVSSSTGFPSPKVSLSESGDTTYWPKDSGSDNAVGAYFVLIGEEVVRVVDLNTSTHTFSIPPGGRGVNGKITAHSPGEKVTLLGFAPYTGKWAAYGYLTNSEIAPQKSMLRPGTCLVSYEGFGNFHTGVLQKQPWTPDTNRSYEFTGYWFVRGQETTLTEDGVPKVTFDLASAGYILEQNKITTEAIRRLKSSASDNEFQAAFDKVGHNRSIPKRWTNYTSWNPDAAQAVPLQIKTEFAQHKTFFEHMQSTNFGKDCEFCQKEYLKYITDQVKKGKKVGDNPIGEARAVGLHIYEESIRVFDGGKSAYEPGPLITYGALMVALAKTLWETPNVGTSTGHPSNETRWTKIPAQLWDNMSQFEGTGLVWRSMLSFTPQDEAGKNIENEGSRNKYGYWKGKLTNGQYFGPDWGNELTKRLDRVANFTTEPLVCPFESTYEKQAWSQPVLDLADINRSTFLFTRQGFPVFAPKGLNLRGDSYRRTGADDNPNAAISKTNYPKPGGTDGVWFVSWGKSISSYNYNFKPEGALTVVYVTGKTAFDSQFTVKAAGTGVRRDGALIWYAGTIGNKEALQYTGGVQQIDTMSLDNLVLGLDWATDPSNWSLILDRGADGFVNMTAFPTIPNLKRNEKLEYKDKKNSPTEVRNLQKLYNFLRIRLYINPAELGKEYIQTVDEDGKFGKKTRAAVEEMQRWMKNLSDASLGDKAIYSRNKIKVDGKWGREESNVIKAWIQINGEYIKRDVWWYAIGGYGWNYYVASVTGLAIPQRKTSASNKQTKTDGKWQVDRLALSKRVEKWQQTFFKQALNIGNQMVEDSINRATVRTIGANIADPRICVGDVIYAQIPGHIEQRDEFGNLPANSVLKGSGATYVTQITRSMDLSSGTYTASYSGYRYRSSFLLEQIKTLPNTFWDYDN